MSVETEKIKQELNNCKSPKPKQKIQRVTISAPYTEELVVSTPSERNWRGILIALLVIIAVLGLIVFSIVLVSPPEEGPRVKGRRPELADIFGQSFRSKRFNGTWISDTEFVFRDMYGGITVYDADNLTSRVLMTNSTFRQLNAEDFKVSSDLKYVLLISDVTRVYKYTTVARYRVVEVSTRSHFPLTPLENDVNNAPFLQYATWAPDGTAVAFVYNNDIYYKPRVQKALVCRITTTGKQGVIFHGIPDWLYENEILNVGHTLWFSNDGHYLMYMSFNDSEVGEYKYPWYESKCMGNPYPKVRSVRYPRVETPNPEVSVHVVNLNRPKYLFPQLLKPTNSVEPGSYVTSASWYSDHQAAVVWLNRRQNVSVIVTCKAGSFNCTDLHIERAECGWTEPILHPVFSRQGGQCLARLPVRDGERGHYMHTCQIQQGVVMPLTHGPFEVTNILAWDEDNHIIYAMATSENSPGQRHLYKIGDTNSSQPWTCLTCHPIIDTTLLSTVSDSVNETAKINSTFLFYYKCDYNDVIFSSGYRYYIQECLGPDVPVVFLVETATNIRLSVLDSSSALRYRVRSVAIPQIKKFKVQIEHGFEAQVQLIYPPGLREYEDLTFPLILLIDSKPGTQSVSEKWEVTWSWYLASNRNFIVAKIDGRGSGYQGEKMRRQIQNELGTVEVRDQLAVLTYIRNTFKFIDKTKVCAVGKGYGGYVAAMMLTEDVDEVINCSVSIAPITNWEIYDSYFTERFMGFRNEQLLAYEKANLTKRAGLLKNRHYFLIHGSADTTVKPQHSMLLARALIEEDVLFRQLVYPDEDHNFFDSQIHMYKQIDQFFDDSFGPISFDDWDSEGGFFIQ